MKKLLARYWGIALVLALLVGLLVPALPVSAGDTAWSTVTTPSAVGAKIVANSNVSYLVMAADGKVMYAYDNINKKLRKSTDSGMTWSTAAGALGTGLNTQFITALAISSGFATDNTLIAATFGATGVEGPAVILMSTDGGLNWFSPINLAVAPASNAVMVVSLAVGPDYQGGTKVLIGTADGAGNGALYSWLSRTFTLINETTGIGGLVAAPAMGTGDVVAVALSPNFLADGEVLAVTANATATVLHAKLATQAWDVATKPATFTGIINAVGMKAVMDFGADYDFSSNAYVLVGFSGSASDDLWRAKIASAASTAADLGIGGVSTTTGVWSIDVKGNLSDGTVYVGYSASAGVATATGVTGTAVFTTTNAKTPSGATNTIVKVAANGVVTGTSGTGAAVCLSTDNASTFNQMSLISFSALGGSLFSDLKVVDGNTMFLVATDPGPVYGVVFKTTDAGVTWWGVYNTASSPIFGVFPSPAYATDSTVYVPLTATLSVKKSVNGGNSFTTAIVGGAAPITAFVAVDGTNFFVGSNGGLLYKSGRFVNFATLTGAENATSIVVGGGDVVVGGAAGNVYRSSDDGITFTALGASGVGATAGQIVTVRMDSAYATNKVIYVGSNMFAGLFKYTTQFSALDNVGPGPASAAGDIALSNDGNVYYGGTVIRRGLNPTFIQNVDQEWDTLQVLPQSALPVGSNVQKLGIVNTLISGTAYVHDVYALVTGVAVSATDYNYVNRVVVFSDKLTNPLTLNTPTAGAVVSTTQNITWTNYPGIPAGVTVKYQAQVAQDTNFTIGLIDSGAILGTLWQPTAGVGVLALQPGSTYYVRVRVFTAFPLVSNWSAPLKFSVKLIQFGSDITGGQNSAISPQPGMAGVNVKPTFSWAGVNNAVSYNLQVADNPVFVNPLDNQTGLNTNVWLETKTLDPGKTYYWRVQAVAADGTTSDWFQFDFTTALPPSATITPTVTTTITAPPVQITLPAQTVTVSPPASPKFFDPVSGLYFNTQSELAQYQAQHPSATPATPAYIWVIIVIAAVLVIAVIVLIARTRRV